MKIDKNTCFSSFSIDVPTVLSYSMGMMWAKILIYVWCCLLSTAHIALICPGAYNAAKTVLESKAVKTTRDICVVYGTNVA